MRVMPSASRQAKAGMWTDLSLTLWQKSFTKTPCRLHRT